MDATTTAGRVAARVSPRSAGHAGFALATFVLGELVRRRIVHAEDARLIVGRAAAYMDRTDPAAASLLDAISNRSGRG